MVQETTKSVLLITGMLNNRDRERAAAALERVKGVVQVDVSLHRAEATVLHRPAEVAAALMLAVADAGYQAVVAQSPQKAAAHSGACRKPRPA